MMMYNSWFIFSVYPQVFSRSQNLQKWRKHVIFFICISQFLQFEKFLKANDIRNHFCVVHFLWYESDSEKSKIKLIAKISGYTVSSYLLILINIICQFSYLYLFLTRTHAKLPYIIIFLQFFMKSTIYAKSKKKVLYIILRLIHKIKQLLEHMLNIFMIKYSYFKTYMHRNGLINCIFNISIEANLNVNDLYTGSNSVN